MSDYKIGEASWDDEDVTMQERPPSDRKRIPFLRMDFNHDYRIRIVSKPYKYYYKWVRNADGKNVKLNSSLTEDCPLTQDGEEPSVGWYAKILHRDSTGKSIPCVLDFGRQIRKAIQKIQNNPDYGKKVHNYDLTISKGTKGDQPLYSVVASPPTPLSDEDKLLAMKINKKEIDGKENPDYIDLEERCKPLPVATIRKILSGDSNSTSTEGDKPASASQPDESGVFEDETVDSKESTEKPETKDETPVAAAANAETVKAEDEDFLDF